MLHNMAKKDVFFPLPRTYSGFTHAMLKRPNTRQSSVLTAHFVAFFVISVIGHTFNTFMLCSRSQAIHL